MKREYREINLEKFVPEEEEKLTKTEKEHIKKQFYESTGITTKGQQKKKQFKWYYIPAACVVFGLCVAISSHLPQREAHSTVQRTTDAPAYNIHSCNITEKQLFSLSPNSDDRFRRSVEQK